MGKKKIDTVGLRKLVDSLTLEQARAVLFEQASMNVELRLSLYLGYASDIPQEYLDSLEGKRPRFCTGLKAKLST